MSYAPSQQNVRDARVSRRAAHRSMLSMRTAVLAALVLMPVQTPAPAVSVPLDLTRREAGSDRRRSRRKLREPDVAGRDGAGLARDVLARSRAAAHHLHRARRRARRPQRSALLSRRDGKAPRRVVRVLRRSDEPSRGDAPRAEHVHAARRHGSQRWRTCGDPVRRLAHGQLRRRSRLHVLPRQPVDSAGSGADDLRCRRRLLLRRGTRDGRRRGSSAGQQHAHRGGLLRHRRRPAPHHAEWVTA